MTHISVCLLVRGPVGDLDRYAVLLGDLGQSGPGPAPPPHSLVEGHVHKVGLCYGQVEWLRGRVRGRVQEGQPAVGGRAAVTDLTQPAQGVLDTWGRQGGGGGAAGDKGQRVCT